MGPRLRGDDRLNCSPSKPKRAPVGRPLLIRSRARQLSAEAIMLRHVLLQVGHVLVVLQEAAVVVAVLLALVLALEVVVAGRALLVAVGAGAVLDHFADPPLFGLILGVDRGVTVIAHV